MWVWSLVIIGGFILYRLYRDYSKKAAQELEWYFQRGVAELTQGNYAEVIVLMNKAITKYPSWQYYLLRGTAYYHLLQLKLAYMDIEESIKQNPDMIANAESYRLKDELKDLMPFY